MDKLIRKFKWQRSAMLINYEAKKKKDMLLLCENFYASLSNKYFMYDFHSFNITDILIRHFLTHVDE